ncbi:hypothetical protein DAEQUDRAFT_755588 [Daedalea quercina L-15889]|uniref:Uncharacterized protein n=1 Tax=Daedalea quercina L-15889 TaxID=1314783 RepID=A0A165SAZ2_9APHY|nr:hypothetical protein DAEQUDRAFT_755588 [Daedalea quercina L-15889]
MTSGSNFPVCDNTLAVSAKATASGPLVLFVKVVGPFIPSIVLRQGDKAQALTLRLLEESQDIMDEDMHSGLQTNYDKLQRFRSKIKGGYIPMKHYREISVYRERAVRLNEQSVASSQYARSKGMWEKKGKNIFPRLRLSKTSTSDLSIVTADRTDETDDQVTISSSNISLLSSADSDATAPDSESMDITSQDPQEVEHTWYSFINPADINPLYDAEADSDSPVTSDVTFDIGLSVSASGGQNQDQASIISYETSA